MTGRRCAWLTKIYQALFVLDGRRVSARGRAAKLREAVVVDGGMSAEVLRFNPNNATTVAVERVQSVDGSRARKALRRPERGAGSHAAH